MHLKQILYGIIETEKDILLSENLISTLSKQKWEIFERKSTRKESKGPWYPTLTYNYDPLFVNNKEAWSEFEQVPAIMTKILLKIVTY